MTAAERKEVYLKLLEAFKKDINYMSTTGFCILLSEYKLGVEDFPELNKQKPNSLYYRHWWSISPNSNGREKRIEALKKAIKLVNKLL